MEEPRFVHSALRHQEMEMGVKIHPIAECLDDGDNPRLEDRPGHGLKIEEKRPDGAAAKIPEKLALEFEEHPKHLRDREDDLAVRNIEKECSPHPLAPHLQPLGVARGTEVARLTGKRQQMFRPAAGATDSSKAAAGVTAVEVLLLVFAISSLKLKSV